MDGLKKKLQINVFLSFSLMCLIHLSPGVLLEVQELHSHSVGMVVSRNILIKKSV